VGGFFFEFGAVRTEPRRSAQVNLIIANEITPHLTAEEYMDKGEYENELKQVIGDTKAAYDISEHDTLVFGSYGLLVAGPNSRHHEPLLCAYLQFITIDIFMQNYFVWLSVRFPKVSELQHHEDGVSWCRDAVFMIMRTYRGGFVTWRAQARLWILSDDMQKTNLIIEGSNKDPTARSRRPASLVVSFLLKRPFGLRAWRGRGDGDDIVPAQALDRIRYRICKIAEDIIKLEEMLGYLLEALDVIEIPPEPPEQAGRSLYERLEISGMRSQLLRRTTDLKKNVGGASRYLEVLREMTGIVAEDRAYNLQRQLETHAKKNLELQENSKQTRIQLTLMLFVFSALMAWGFLDRLTGNSWTVMTSVLCFNVRSWPRVSWEHARARRGARIAAELTGIRPRRSWTPSGPTRSWTSFPPFLLPGSAYH
jgi:hypothetical protein